MIEYGEERLPLLSELKGGRSYSDRGATGGATSMSRSDTKDMDVGNHNLNKSNTDNTLQSKMNFTVNQQPEVKIINAPENPIHENKENVVPQINRNVQDNALGAPQENTGINQQRKLSSKYCSISYYDLIN